MKSAESVDQAILDARQALRDKLGESRTGGKGSARRKKRTVHKGAGTDDKRLQATLKRVGMNTVPGIEEVNMFKESGEVLHFANPKVQASIGSNTYVIAGHAEEKQLTEMLPGIISQLGPDNLSQLKHLASTLGGGDAPKQGDDDDVPD